MRSPAGQVAMKILVRAGAGLAMLAVAVLCAFFAMRMAIHGREVEVPNLAGMSDGDAAAAAKKLGLNLSVENRFYASAVTPNHVLSQSPVAGSRVRRGWQVRVTESLGTQKVEVPDVTGQGERPASLVLRRSQLELGAVAHLPAGDPVGVVLAQSPAANSGGLTGPRVGLLISDEQEAPGAAAYVMPSIVGMTLGAAGARLGTVGLHIASAQQPEAAVGDASAVPPAGSAPPNPLDPSFDVAPPPVSVNAVIVAQSPLPGHRVTRGDAVRVTLGQ